MNLVVWKIFRGSNFVQKFGPFQKRRHCARDKTTSVFASKSPKFPHASAKHPGKSEKYAFQRVWNGAFVVSARGKIHQMYDSSIYYVKGLTTLYRQRVDVEKEKFMREDYSELLSDDSFQIHPDDPEDAVF